MRHIDRQPSAPHRAPLTPRLTTSSYSVLVNITRGLSTTTTVCLSICVFVCLWSQSGDWSLIFYFFSLERPQEKNTLLFTPISHARVHIDTQIQYSSKIHTQSNLSPWWLTCFGQGVSRDTYMSVRPFYDHILLLCVNFPEKLLISKEYPDTHSLLSPTALFMTECRIFSNIPPLFLQFLCLYGKMW